MAAIELSIRDHAIRITLQSLVRRAGHHVVEEHGDVVLSDDLGGRFDDALQPPVLLVAHASEIPDAIAAMQRGAYDYVYIPLQPDEVALRIARALVSDGDAHTITPEVVTLAEAEQRVIRDALLRCNNNRSEAARQLGIGRNTLWRKMKQAPRQS